MSIPIKAAGGKAVVTQCGEESFMLRIFGRRIFFCVAASLLFSIVARTPIVAAQGRHQREGALIKLQSLDLGGYAYHIAYLLNPSQSLVRVGDYIIAVGGTSGSMVYDYYDKARLYRIRANGTLAFVRSIPVRARALVRRGDTVYAIAFDPDKQYPRDDDGNRLYITKTHIEGFQLTGAKGQARFVLRQKPPLGYTTFMKWLTPLADAIAVVEIPRPQHASTDRVSLLSSGANRILATHFVRKKAATQPSPSDSAIAYMSDLNETLMSLSANDEILAARLSDGRIRLLDIGDSLRVRYEMKLRGLRLIALSGHTLYAYTVYGAVHAFDVTDPGNPSQLWVRTVTKVPDPKGIVIDGDRIIVHGIGLTEMWSNDAHPPAYYRVGYRWKSLECVIASGDLIYAFNSPIIGFQRLHRKVNAGYVHSDSGR